MKKMLSGPFLFPTFQCQKKTRVCFPQVSDVEGNTVCLLKGDGSQRKESVFEQRKDSKDSLHPLIQGISCHLPFCRLVFLQWAENYLPHFALL